jgi:hypothetical protein
MPQVRSPASTIIRLGELGMFEMAFTYSGRTSAEPSKDKFSFRAIVKRENDHSGKVADPESFSMRYSDDLEVGVHNQTDVKHDRFFVEIDKHSMESLFQPCQDFLTGNGKKGDHPPSLPPLRAPPGDDNKSLASNETGETAPDHSIEGPASTQTGRPPSRSCHRPESTIQTQEPSTESS